tara:strand:+ start:352 stop:576 length:225 start_codon:yes stop_codon:yes gene_type:complete
MNNKKKRSKSVHKRDDQEIDILMDTLKANVKVLDMLHSSNKKDKTHYLLLVTNELKKLCETAIPILQSNNINTA